MYILHDGNKTYPNNSVLKLFIFNVFNASYWKCNFVSDVPKGAAMVNYWEEHIDIFGHGKNVIHWKDGFIVKKKIYVFYLEFCKKLNLLFTNIVKCLLVF